MYTVVDFAGLSDTRVPILGTCLGCTHYLDDEITEKLVVVHSRNVQLRHCPTVHAGLKWQYIVGTSEFTQVPYFVHKPLEPAVEHMDLTR